MNLKAPQAALTNFPAALRPYCHKILRHRYWGRDYQLLSSQQLFSATQIDRGSQLLLASLLPRPDGEAVIERLLHGATEAQTTQEPRRLAIWDWGCGIGTLGLLAQGHAAQVFASLQKLGLQASLDCELRVFDRDALALAFCEANWRCAQKLREKDAGFSPRFTVTPDIWGEAEILPPERPAAHLVLSNVPAKLGEPVLRLLLPELAAAPESYVAAVIIAPLRHLFDEAEARGKIEILHRSGSGDHSVYHYRRQVPPAESGPRRVFQLPPALELYKRGESCFALERRGRSVHLRKYPHQAAGQPPLSPAERQTGTTVQLSWPFHSAYGLPDFEQPGHALELQVRLLSRRNWGGRVLIWEPGHGHLACFLAQKPGSHIRHIDLAGRDRLALLFARHNLENLHNFPGGASPSCAIHSLPCPELLREEMDSSAWDLAIFNLPDKYSPEQSGALNDWIERTSCLHPNSRICLLGRSQALRHIRPKHEHPFCVAELRAHGLVARLLWRTVTDE